MLPNMNTSQDKQGNGIHYATTHAPTFEMCRTHAVGTVRELVQAGIECNGVLLDKAMLSVLIALDMLEEVGTAEKYPGASGIAPKIYRVKFEQQSRVSIAPVNLTL